MMMSHEVMKEGMNAFSFSLSVLTLDSDWGFGVGLIRFLTFVIGIAGVDVQLLIVAGNLRDY